jgi:A/G-specific adenine glycosylase
MLQQTQLPRVIVIFRQFLQTFPTLSALAAAGNRDVILAWRGMGFNSRALRLRDAAKTIMTEHGGVFPRETEDLLAIKGIGGYTAAAVRNFAFHLPTPCIDTNIRRILHRTFVGPENADGTWEMNDKALLKIAAEVLEVAVNAYERNRGVRRNQGNRSAESLSSDSSHSSESSVSSPAAAEWHAALMDFGSLVQTKRGPKWDVCPLTANGIMKTTPDDWRALLVEMSKQKAVAKTLEPGRLIAGTFVPNRIIRGRIVEELRDHPDGKADTDIGAAVCIDWNPAEHDAWLAGLLAALERDGMIAKRARVWALAS